MLNHMSGGGNDAYPYHRNGNGGSCTYWPGKSSSAGSPYYTQVRAIGHAEGGVLGLTAAGRTSHTCQATTPSCHRRKSSQLQCKPIQQLAHDSERQGLLWSWMMLGDKPMIKRDKRMIVHDNT